MVLIIAALLLGLCVYFRTYFTVLSFLLVSVTNSVRNFSFLIHVVASNLLLVFRIISSIINKDICIRYLGTSRPTVL